MTQFTCKGVKQINNRISLNMTFTFTIRISQHFLSAQEFQMGNFQKQAAIKNSYKPLCKQE
jgi:predicted nucleotide-binding protein